MPARYNFVRNDVHVVTSQWCVHVISVTHLDRLVSCLAHYAVSGLGYTSKGLPEATKNAKCSCADVVVARSCGIHHSSVGKTQFLCGGFQLTSALRFLCQQFFLRSALAVVCIMASTPNTCADREERLASVCCRS